MEIIKSQISIDLLKKMARRMFGNLIKAVVDVEKKVMAVDGELHSDEEALLLENGSQQNNLWGINLYPEKKGKEWIELDSMINLRPSLGNLSRGVADPKIQKKIIAIVNQLVVK